MTEGTFDLAQQRKQLVTYVATDRHPWDSAETVRLYELAVQDKVAGWLSFQHMPKCECETAGAPHDNRRDPKCVEWDKIVRRSLRTLGDR